MPSLARRSFSSSTRDFADGPSTSSWTRHRGTTRTRQQHVGRTFDEAADDLASAVFDLVEGRHQLVLGVERNFCDAWIEPPRLLDVQPALGGEDDKGALGRDHRCMRRRG